MKVIKMIVIHDIPEAIHGDLPNLPINAHLQDAKHQREEKAAIELFGMLPEPLKTEYYELYMEFEHQGSLEAKVGKALDRIEAQLQHVDSGSKFWTEGEIGDTLLTYPESVIEDLGDEGVGEFWKIIKKEMKQLHDEAGLSYSDAIRDKAFYNKDMYFEKIPNEKISHNEVIVQKESGTIEIIQPFTYERKEKYMHEILTRKTTRVGESKWNHSEFVIADTYASDPEHRDKFLLGGCFSIDEDTNDTKKPRFISTSWV